jgi:hypothetical protein
MAVLFAAGDMNAAAALWGSGIVQAGDFIANGVRLLLGIRHISG